jgi:hypothetical protein
MPELADVELLISQARTLRLEMTKLTAFEPISETARSGAEALTQAGLALEKIVELLVSSRSRKRPHRKTAPSTLPSLEKEPV